MRTRMDAVMSAILTLAAVAVATALVRREFFPDPGRLSAPNYALTFVPGWEKLLVAGIQSGKADAPIKLIEFTDLECPFCRQFHTTVRAAQRKYANRVSHVFVHYPIAGHRFARLAARASECANDQGDFTTFIDVVFAKQDSLGLKPWAEYAREGGVSDSARFARCIADTSVVSQ